MQGQQVSSLRTCAAFIVGRHAVAVQEPTARHTAALALAKVAAIELPGVQWPDLVKLLLGNMSVQPPDPGLRQSTLQVPPDIWACGGICVVGPVNRQWIIGSAKYVRRSCLGDVFMGQQLPFLTHSHSKQCYLHAATHCLMRCMTAG